jgi:hypothetical protein
VFLQGFVTKETAKDLRDPLDDTDNNHGSSSSGNTSANDHSLVGALSPAPWQPGDIIGKLGRGYRPTGGTTVSNGISKGFSSLLT